MLVNFAQYGTFKVSLKNDKDTSKHMIETNQGEAKEFCSRTVNWQNV